MYNIHISDIRSFLKCRRAWAWASPLRDNLEPSLPYAPFYVGRAVHYCIEMWKIADVPFNISLDRFLENEKAQMGEIDYIDLEQNLQLVRKILHHYEVTWTNALGDFSDNNLEFIEMERPFTVPLNLPYRKDVFLEGRFDGIVQRKDDRSFWIFETKTTRSISEFIKTLYNDNQCTVYTWAANQLKDFPIKGVLYNIIRKAAPEEPHLVSGGLLSQNKAQKVSYFSYLDAIKRTHPAFEDSHIQSYYGEFLYKLQNMPNEFFMRQPVRRTQEETEATMAHVRYIASDMINEGLPLYPNPSWLSCTYCQFRNPCVATERGQDVKPFLEAEFRRKVVAESLRTTEEL